MAGLVSGPLALLAMLLAPPPASVSPQAWAVAAVGHLDEAGVLVHTNTTLCRDNLHECRRMPSFVAERLGRRKFSMNLVIPTGSAELNDSVALHYEELAPHLDAIAAASERAGRVAVSINTSPTVSPPWTVSPEST